jgi:hypothetical protein
MVCDCIEVMAREASFGQRRSAIWRTAYATEHKLHDALACEFGRRFEWRHIPDPDYARLEQFCGVCEDDGDNPERIMLPPRYDHPSFYAIDSELVAITSQPYDFSAEDRREAWEWAGARGLAFWRPVDYPSWWYPGQTTLCVFARPDALPGGQALGETSESRG